MSKKKKNITIIPLLMENHTNNLVSDDVGNYKSKSLYDLHGNQYNHSTNDIKLSFNKNSSANYYLHIYGCPNKNHLGKSFKIIKSDANSTFFNDLYKLLISDKKDIPLIKHFSTSGSPFWTKSHFNILTEKQINFSIAKDVFNYRNEMKINKLINILANLEAKSGIEITKKYLKGFLEERGILTFNEYINHTFVNN